MTVTETRNSAEAEETLSTVLSDGEKTKILTLAANGALISAGQFHISYSGMMEDLGKGIAQTIGGPLAVLSDDANNELDGTVERFFESDQADTVGQLSDVQGELYQSIRTSSEDMLSFFTDASIKQARELIDENPENLPVLSQEITIEELIKTIAVQNALDENNVDRQSAEYFSELAKFVQVVTPI